MPTTYPVSVFTSPEFVSGQMAHTYYVRRCHADVTLYVDGTAKSVPRNNELHDAVVAECALNGIPCWCSDLMLGFELVSRDGADIRHLPRACQPFGLLAQTRHRFMVIRCISSDLGTTQCPYILGKDVMKIIRCDGVPKQEHVDRFHELRTAYEQAHRSQDEL